VGADDDWQIGGSHMQNRGKPAQNHHELAHFGVMLQKFSFEWPRFSPQLHMEKGPGITAGRRGIHVQLG
jgi:hypothetical protein